MKQFVENFFAVLALCGAEAWFLHGYFAGNPEFEPALATVLAAGVLLAKDPLKEKFGMAKSAKAHDRDLFAAFQQAVPYEPSIRLLKEQDFGDSIRRQALQPLFDFSTEWDSVEREFLDKKLEKERKALLKLAKDFVNEIAGRTVPIQLQGFISVVSDNQRASGNPRPPHVLEDARVLNQKAPTLAAAYEAFVRACREALSQ